MLIGILWVCLGIIACIALGILIGKFIKAGSRPDIPPE